VEKVREIKTHINKWILTYKPTMTGMEIGKLPSRHISRGSEREKNTYKYMDFDIRSNNDRH
jgi:hypothetical protein